MTQSDQELLRDALVHFELMQQYAEREPADQLVVDAICMRMSAGLEVLNRLDHEVLAGLFGGAWPMMWGMRNGIAHGYLLVNAAIIRRTLDCDIPPIVAAIKRALFLIAGYKDEVVGLEGAGCRLSQPAGSVGRAS